MKPGQMHQAEGAVGNACACPTVPASGTRGRAGEECQECRCR